MQDPHLVAVSSLRSKNFHVDWRTPIAQHSGADLSENGPLTSPGPSTSAQPQPPINNRPPQAPGSTLLAEQQTIANDRDFYLPRGLFCSPNAHVGQAPPNLPVADGWVELLAIDQVGKHRVLRYIFSPDRAWSLWGPQLLSKYKSVGDLWEEYENGVRVKIGKEDLGFKPPIAVWLRNWGSAAAPGTKERQQRHAYLNVVDEIINVMTTDNVNSASAIEQLRDEMDASEGKTQNAEGKTRRIRPDGTENVNAFEKFCADRRQRRATEASPGKRKKVKSMLKGKGFEMVSNK